MNILLTRSSQGGILVEDPDPATRCIVVNKYSQHFGLRLVFEVDLQIKTMVAGYLRIWIQF